MNHPTFTLLFIFTTFPPEVSGSAQYNWERVQWFAKEGYRVIVLAPDWEESCVPSVPPDLENTLTIETYPSKPWLLYKLLRVPTFSAADRIRDRIARYQPDLITVVDVERLFFFSTWHLPGRRDAKARNIPYITEYHTDYYNHVGTYPGGKLVRELFLKPLTRALYRQCDATIAVSSASRKGLQQIGVVASRTILMYGIDTAEYSPNRRDRKGLELWLTAEEKPNKVLLFLGRLAMEKRLDVLIEAFAKLKSKYSNCSLIIAGEGPDDATQKLKRLAQPIPNIHFIGFVHGEAKANLLASCDVYCSPSPYETFGRSVVEAMASGIPVVTVNSGGVSDYIVDGANGYLVPPDSVEAMTQAIEKVLAHPHPEMIQRALQTAEDSSTARGCEKLNGYYQQLLTSKDWEVKTAKISIVSE